MTAPASPLVVVAHTTGELPEVLWHQLTEPFGVSGVQHRARYDGFVAAVRRHPPPPWVLDTVVEHHDTTPESVLCATWPRLGTGHRLTILATVQDIDVLNVAVESCATPQELFALLNQVHSIDHILELLNSAVMGTTPCVDVLRLLFRRAQGGSQVCTDVLNALVCGNVTAVRPDTVISFLTAADPTHTLGPVWVTVLHAGVFHLEDPLLEGVVRGLANSEGNVSALARWVGVNPEAHTPLLAAALAGAHHPPVELTALCDAPLEQCWDTRLVTAYTTALAGDEAELLELVSQADYQQWTPELVEPMITDPKLTTTTALALASVTMNTGLSVIHLMGLRPFDIEFAQHLAALAPNENSTEHLRAAGTLDVVAVGVLERWASTSQRDSQPDLWEEWVCHTGELFGTLTCYTAHVAAAHTDSVLSRLACIYELNPLLALELAADFPGTVDEFASVLRTSRM